MSNEAFFARTVELHMLLSPWGVWASHLDVWGKLDFLELNVHCWLPSAESYVLNHILYHHSRFIVLLIRFHKLVISKWGISEGPVLLVCHRPVVCSLFQYRLVKRRCSIFLILCCGAVQRHSDWKFVLCPHRRMMFAQCCVIVRLPLRRLWLVMTIKIRRKPPFSCCWVRPPSFEFPCRTVGSSP